MVFLIRHAFVIKLFGNSGNKDKNYLLKII